MGGWMNKNKYVENLDLFLGKKLKDFRERIGWSQTELGEKIGLSHQQIFKYEQGCSTIPTHTLYKFLQIFDINPNVFFEGFKSSFPMEKDRNHDLAEKKEIIDVLLIDDDSRQAFIVSQALDPIKYKLNIYCLRNYDEVSKFLRRQMLTSPFPRPDLILLDLTIEKEKSFSILKALKQDQKMKYIPIVVLTNSLNRIDVMNAYANHASGYIGKTIEFEIFQKNLQKAIEYWSDVVILPGNQMMKAA